MSMSFDDMKKGQEEAKRLARARVLSVSPNRAVPRDRNRDGSVPRDRNEPYRRGSVSDGRYSSRERVPRDRNLDQRSGNSQRDRSHSRDRNYSSGPRDRLHDSRDNRSASRDRASFANSRDKAYFATSGGQSRTSERRDFSTSRSQSRDGGYSSSWSQRRQQSQSPRRLSGAEPKTDRISRRDDSSPQRQRDRSFAARQTYPKMRKGENCSLDYNPLKTKSCSKCSRGGHHEFECFKYEKYNPRLCSTCEKYHHFATDCKELDKFPPKGNELSHFETFEAGKNW
jgi:hypothetical protein